MTKEELDEKVRKYRIWEEEQMAKEGFIIHKVFDQCKPGFVNMHTHGLEKVEGGQNIRIVLDIPCATKIIHEIGKKVIEGSLHPLHNSYYRANGVCYGYFIDDPDDIPEMDETNMLRFIITQDLDTGRSLDMSSYIEQSYPMIVLNKPPHNDEES